VLREINSKMMLLVFKKKYEFYKFFKKRVKK